MISLTVKMAEQNKKKGCLLEHSQEGPHDCTGVALGNSCLGGKSKEGPAWYSSPHTQSLH